MLLGKVLMMQLQWTGLRKPVLYHFELLSYFGRQDTKLRYYQAKLMIFSYIRKQKLIFMGI